MPIYYATGHKWKAFMWASLSGLTEPIGTSRVAPPLRERRKTTPYLRHTKPHRLPPLRNAPPAGGICGYAALQSVFTDVVYGCTFSMVGGMMVFIVCHELLPVRRRPPAAHWPPPS